ncbi:hypothetical protein HYC85_015030 [Camellia sinensis]|uniref:Purple acid phosphatase n=1 Tax=Camellia sinensis TaxID=4442 RepID=A0A7J7H801_CAMSI|nr:hypothetical protein HYC85_015030 [Camellia sinensis]
MIISWVTPVEKYPNVVTYWEAGTKHLHKLQTHSEITTYRYYNYASGYIHHATIKDLTFDTKYFYEVASNEVTHQFSFTTPLKPGPDVPYTFGVIGDLGQTADSNRTLEHYMSNPIKGQAVLFAGDLSYADDHPNHDNTKWNTFGRFIEKSVVYQPWIWSAGNHEIDLASNLKPILSSHICTAIMYPTRHPRVLPHFGIQLSVHRHISLFFLLTQPMGNIPRNTNGLNKSSQRITDMKLHRLLLFYMLHGTIPTTTITWKEKYKFDIVFASHVHSYERSERISNIKYSITNGLSLPVRDINVPVYITIGDGGNMEGIANKSVTPSKYQH